MNNVKDDLLYISHIADSIAAIELYTKDVDFKTFCSNPMMYDAVIRKLQVNTENFGGIKA